MYTVNHEVDQQRFIVVTHGGESQLTYRLNGINIDFDHTFVCPADRGSRVGVSLVKTGVDWARQNNYVLSACWYVERYLSKLPE